LKLGSQESLYVRFVEKSGKILSEENIRFSRGTGDQTRKGMRPEDANTTTYYMENAITNRRFNIQRRQISNSEEIAITLLNMHAQIKKTTDDKFHDEPVDINRTHEKRERE
jgi:hypothetical protein